MLDRLHPNLVPIIEASKGTSLATSDMTASETRKALNPVISDLAESPGPIGQIRDIKVPARDYEIPVRLYYPDSHDQATASPLPLLTYIHGGGWALGNIETHDSICRALAMESDVITASIDYRLAPEHKFPVPLEDCYTALCWLHTHAEKIGALSDKLAIAGDSAGGNLATACCFKVLDENGPNIDYQVLIYPVIDISNFERNSYKEYSEHFILKRSSMRSVAKSYSPSIDEYKNPLVSPIYRKELNGLPDTLILSAELDILFDEGKEYAQRLEKSGIPTEWINCKGMIHLFWGMRCLSREENGISLVARRLKEKFQGS